MGRACAAVVPTGHAGDGRRNFAALTLSVCDMNLFQPENLILASTSERRRALLQSAGYHFRVAAPLVDEPATPRNHPCGAAHAESLAFFKASSLSEPFHDCVLQSFCPVVCPSRSTRQSWRPMALPKGLQRSSSELEDTRRCGTGRDMADGAGWIWLWGQ